MAIICSSHKLAVLALTFVYIIPTCLGFLQQTYCSNQNTGTDHHADTSIYESLGNCQTKCKANYAYAIVQSRECWCSNYAPSDQLNLEQCNDNCIGYPFEHCGNLAAGLFGYLQLDRQPSGTANPASQTTSSSKSQATMTKSETVDVTVTEEHMRTSPTSTITPGTTPITIETLATVSGSVITSTVTVPATSASNAAEKKGQTKTKMSSGSVVAIAVAVVVASIVLLAAILVGWCCWRRKRSGKYNKSENEDTLQRNPSILSKAGLLGTSQSRSTIDPYIQSSNAMSERRNSRPLVIDQRLNPNALMVHDDGSRSSFVSMQDNRDYTRTLNVRNPDPANVT